ncbi:Threonine/homoserine efflux transporter RhtA [Marinitoga hydrogenitolerans DSM 16785]|uniref:Threonine/homoserine efflux transporter RhtA n=1 Tax=Marinitoga hydrogenitolerans (strain DSM 16785 / JCM 12826 / AT1271) TaxID=1122195 RepID=A0A1M4XAG6_MARH1|nr:DMT family transporter [Marinitoga hydrogenitolerans]SHE90431.1 Threonine/homoserine efflux transporter RhtA [Marinitoga hydrogenitolerans DSM 16785]
MHYLLAVLSAFSSSVTSVLGKYSFNIGATVSQILFLRFLFSFLISGAIFVLVGYKFHFKKFIFFSFLGIINYGIAAYAFFVGLQYLNPAYATVIYFTNPIFVSLLQTKTTNKKLNIVNASAVALSFVGVIIANIGEKAFLSNQSIVFGTLMVLFSSFVNALFVVSVSKKIKEKKSNPFENAFYTFAGTFIYYFILVILNEEVNTLSGKFLLSGFVLAVLATFVPLTLNYISLKKLQSHTLSLIMPLELVFASILSVIIFKESFNALKIIGFLMVGLAPIIDISNVESQSF